MLVAKRRSETNAALTMGLTPDDYLSNLRRYYAPVAFSVNAVNVVTMQRSAARINNTHPLLALCRDQAQVPAVHQLEMSRIYRGPNFDKQPRRDRPIDRIQALEVRHACISGPSQAQNPVSGPGSIRP